LPASGEAQATIENREQELPERSAQALPELTRQPCEFHNEAKYEIIRKLHLTHANRHATLLARLVITQGGAGNDNLSSQFVSAVDQNGGSLILSAPCNQ
jgi:hypothetical protein